MEPYGLLAGAREVIFFSELGSHLAATGMTKTDLALRVGLRKNTTPGSRIGIRGSQV